MDFWVLNHGDRMLGYGAFLIIDRWNDFGFETLFTLYYHDPAGLREIGPVKIGMAGMTHGRVELPEHFERLDDRYFSLGQDISYYEGLKELGDRGQEILRTLRDISFDNRIYRVSVVEEALKKSLLRHVRNSLVHGQFARVARGGASQVEYGFAYEWPASPSGDQPDRLEFVVTPGSNPPTNMHALIGSNGVGKTRLLGNIARVIAGETNSGRAGSMTRDLTSFRRGDRPESGFSTVIMMSFSALDPPALFPDTTVTHGLDGVRCIRISLGDEGIDDDLPDPPLGQHPRSGPAHSYARRVEFGFNPARRRRWESAVSTLEADPLLEAADILGNSHRPEDAARLFDSLSSGHKIVLLAVTALTEMVADQALVLIDEPEMHLHPPLLAAFIKAVSDLLVDYNGAAIIATHSPVVLQEIPRTCVYMLHRSGDVVAVKRPKDETYGENVGRLTHEVFGLEVTKTGVHARLREAVDEGLTFEDTLDRFDGRLGIEAQVTVRALISVRDRRNSARS